ncbi:Uncharacterised protein [Mycobacteroides abscessus subsp. abscessus]|uniref:hypothetical protein n=1 Tax=Mycobacteriaceae TaxID=1762 RepID=UPI0005E155C5|nr:MULTISPECIES: hypothetical protein [Mycobacteriaceae]ANO17382.1 hypothetical protein BAB78_01255 [Mycobacteroides abscessus]MDB2220980.1 hypothetical protein [Mycobacteroides abscessus subsp. abscessus]OTR08833.1 hypothetical protein B9M85_01210 [Mycobacteroides abscessus]RIS02752.1 hypothetical protein D2E45_12285 [Mycobacteroides abscessus]RIS67520.1 hypothetical protein D2E70_16235 [Mycobacteroides abscessus]
MNEKRTLDLIEANKHDSLRPARPMTPAEFEKACTWYGATVNCMARWDEAVAHAARFGLILENVPLAKTRKKS